MVKWQSQFHKHSPANGHLPLSPLPLKVKSNYIKTFLLCFSFEWEIIILIPVIKTTFRPPSYSHCLSVKVQNSERRAQESGICYEVEDMKLIIFKKIAKAIYFLYYVYNNPHYRYCTHTSMDHLFSDCLLWYYISIVCKIWGRKVRCFYVYFKLFVLLHLGCGGSSCSQIEL